MNIQREFKYYSAKLKLPKEAILKATMQLYMVLLLQTHMAHKNLLIHFSVEFLVNVYLKQQKK